MSDHQRSPLGWTATERGPDVSIYLDNAMMLSDILTCVDGNKKLGILPPGSVCMLTNIINQELRTAVDILEQGDVSST